MALLHILEFPDPKLKIQASFIIEMTQKHEIMIQNMFETMYQAQGIGLAATQVDYHHRIIVIDLADIHEPLCLINPNIITQQGEYLLPEACLSFPGIHAKIKRAKSVKIKYFDKYFKPQTLEATGILSQCIQHEIDHLNGITFFDHLSPLKQKMLRNKLRQTRKRKS